MPHVVAPSDGPRGGWSWSAAGSAGWRRRGCRPPRGHEVILLEATDRLGGQINLAAKAAGARGDRGHRRLARGRDRAAGVDVRLNSYAEADDVPALAPDVVIVATGGLPDTASSRPGEDLVASVWDVLGGYVEPAGERAAL